MLTVIHVKLRGHLVKYDMDVTPDDIPDDVGTINEVAIHNSEEETPAEKRKYSVKKNREVDPFDKRFCFIFVTFLHAKGHLALRKESLFFMVSKGPPC